MEKTMCDGNCDSNAVKDINVVHQEKGRRLAVQELAEEYSQFKYKKEDDIKNFFYRLGDYCIDTDDSDTNHVGYGLPEWLSKDEALYIIYCMLDPIKRYYMNK